MAVLNRKTGFQNRVSSLGGFREGLPGRVSGGPPWEGLGRAVLNREGGFRRVLQSNWEGADFFGNFSPSSGRRNGFHYYGERASHKRTVVFTNLQITPEKRTL